VNVILLNDVVGFLMAIRDVLLLGNPRLYDRSEPVLEGELSRLGSVVDDLHDTLMDFRSRYGAGRAIAAPQIGVFKRLIYMHVDEPEVLINPRLEQESAELMEVWDDCLCFPDLLVKVMRHRSCRIQYRDREWRQRSRGVEGDLSELLQHEYDHLDGILAVSRAIDGQSFALRSEKRGNNHQPQTRLR
jgi:peptide deformylase